jgi:hypothetical protein
MKNNVRRGLFHPDDIKIIGLSNITPGPLSAPLPSLSRKPSRPSISPLGSLGPSSASSYSHSRSGSLATPGSAGSFGQAEAKKLQNQTEFGKYTEDDEEDYDDVFGKPNATCELAGWLYLFSGRVKLIQFYCSYRASYTDSTTEYTTVEQVMGTSICPLFFIEAFFILFFLAG